MLRNSRGMTLIEIMIVLVILSSLGAILAQSVMGKLETARVRETKILIAEVQKALDLYNTDCGSYPQSLESLVKADPSCPSWGPEPYLKKIQKDAWNHDLIYENDNGTSIIRSLGKDGKEGGSGYAADIDNQIN
jgi:general secretion pathway protein G